MNWWKNLVFCEILKGSHSWRFLNNIDYLKCTTCGLERSALDQWGYEHRPQRDLLDI